jgi:8-oxo-dGTP pyrophosphatase MutT (NUDIX family)
MSASEISLDRAKPDKLFYFVANVIIFRKTDRRCLILKRSERETTHPGRYAFVGGKLEWNDLDLAKPTRINGDVIDFEGALEALLFREALEEANVSLDTSGLTYVNSVAFVRPDGVPAMLVKFLAAYSGGEVVVESGSFTDFAWVNAEEVRAYNCIDGVMEEIVQVEALLAATP